MSYYVERVLKKGICFCCFGILRAPRDDVTLSSPWRPEMAKSTMAAEMSEETAAGETMFLCSSCGFECRYEYFGRKPPFSKSVVYVFCCFV